MIASPADREIAVNLWQSLRSDRPLLSLLTTASARGAPHTTWMGTLRSLDRGELLTLTSPDSLKVRNIRENPLVECLVSETNRRELLYLHGRAEVVEDVAELKRSWNRIQGKEQAFFLKYFNTGPGFAIIRTRVESVELVIPEEFRKAPIPLEDLGEGAPSGH